MQKLSGMYPGRAEHAILRVILGWRCFANPAVFVVGGALCDAGTPLWALISLLRGSFHENRVVGNRCNSYVGSPHRAESAILGVILAGHS